MTLLKPPRSVGADDAWVAAGRGAGSDAGVEVPAGSPSCDAAAPEGRRRRLLLGAPDVLSGFAAETGEAAAGGGSGSGPLAPAGRRRLRRRGDAAPAAEAEAAEAAGSWGRSRSREARWRLTLAPTSPSAQSSPSAVMTSTRHTTMEFGAAPIGGRFWVSVQRA